MDSTVSARTGHSTIAAVSSEPGIVSLSFDQRYEAVSQAFPPWLLSDPIVFPGDHRTYGWACQVPDCNGELAGSNIKFLCSTHDHEFKALSSKLTIEEFAKQATPSPCILRGWARYRLDDCRICGPNREALITGLCMAHNRILWKAKRRGETEEACLRAQTPFPPLPRCAIPDCVHDGPLFNFRGPGQVRVCKSHYQVWRSYLRDNNLSPDEALWTEWAAMEPRSKRMQLPENRGDVWVDHLPLRLQREIRYAIHRHDSTARRGHWRPRHIQVVVDVLASEGVQTLNDPMLAEHVSKYKAADVRRIWADLPIAARGLTLTRQDAKYAGWFDPAIVGAKQFKSANSPSDRRMVWDLTGISQRWLRDLLWENLEYAATESPQPTSGTINRRVRSIHLLSKALWQLREDHGNDPELLHASDARAFKDLWDMWYREQVPVAENRTFNSPVPKPLVELVYKTSPNAMHAVLVFGRARNLGPTDSFVLAFPRYSAPEERPKPRPISDDDFRLLISDASLKLLDESDVNDVGLVDIWLTHAFQGGRISETIYLRLGCIGMIGEAQPYLWRDITKANVLDYGMPCHYPVYQRLLRRQEVTRAKLRRRYAADLASLNKRQRAALEAEWDRTMPLFPGPTTNPDLRLPVSSSVLQRKLADWIEKLGLKGITTHRTRSTMATALLDNGAPPALVRQILGHFSEEALAHYARYNDDTVIRHLRQVWTAGPGMESPGKVLMTPVAASGLGSEAAVAGRIDLTVIPVEHGLCRYGPVVGGSACPVSKNCSSGPNGPCPHFVLTGADLAYWERKRDAAYHFAEGAPSEDARDYILSEWKPWERVLARLRNALEELGLLEAAEKLDLRSPRQDFFHPLFSTGWQLDGLQETTAVSKDDQTDRKAGD